MATSIKEIASLYEPFILAQLEHFETTLHPSSTEDEDLIRRASFAVRNKAVAVDRFIPFSETLYVNVQDVRPAEVRILLKDEDIICSCKNPQICRHKVAAIFTLYQYLHSVQDWTANWRAKKNVQLASLANKRSPESWKKMSDEVMQHLLNGDQKVESYSISMIMENARIKLDRFLPFEHEWRALFKLFMELSTLNYLWKHLLKTNSSVSSDYFQYYMDKSYDQIQHYCADLNSKARLFAADPFYDAIQHLTRELLLQREGLPHMRLDIYMHIWCTTLFESNRATVERAHLLQSDTVTDIEKNLVPLLFDILTKQSNELSSYAPFIQPALTTEVMAYATLAKKMEQKEILSFLLEALLPHLHLYFTTIAKPANRPLFVRKIDALYAQITLTDTQQMTLYHAYGKYGVHPFSDFLLRQKRYEEWVALHQLYPSSLAHLETIGLKQILEEQPTIALPLYHHYAMEELRQKSRMNYKQAVRIWKAMKNLCKKAGRTTYFEQYMLAIQQQFKRLRALQEEIEKSNLLS